VYEDEIVVEKRRVLKEELVVKKNAVDDAQSAAGNLRKDKISGDKSEPPNQSPADERR
jgi:stress response protein YsnF